jgi:hypothetical protein
MREAAEAPPLEIRTKILVPEVKAAWAREVLRSKSMARCAANDPAARAVVQSAEMKMVGGGWRAERDLDQVCCVCGCDRSEFTRWWRETAGYGSDL